MIKKNAGGNWQIQLSEVSKMEKFQRELLKVLRDQNEKLRDIEIALLQLSKALQEEKVTVIVNRRGD